MNVNVKCFSTLSNTDNCSYDRTRRYSLPENKTTVKDIADRVPVSKSDISVIFVNGRRAELGTALNDGDRVAFVPPVGGM
jgi:molybdopterin converting factor small subunit